jgi:hypothetical protein
MHHFRNVCVCFVLMVSVIGMAQEETPLLRAHSHNDYEQSRPLFNALDQGVCSIEADIHLVDGELLVAHDRKDADPRKTLQSLYLDPLKARVEENRGRVYPGGPSLLLLIDIKSDAESAYARLQEILTPYHGMLTRFTPTSTDEKAVTIILSGNRPINTVLTQRERWVGIDGRLDDLEKSINQHQMPLISASWSSTFSWKGKDAMPPAQRKRLRDLVAQTHARGQRLRFWGLPRPATLWPELHQAGVDLLNADNLALLRTFLTTQKPK